MIFDVTFKIRKSPWYIVEVSSATTAAEAVTIATKQAKLEIGNVWYSVQAKRIK